MEAQRSLSVSEGKPNRVKRIAMTAVGLVVVLLLAWVAREMLTPKAAHKTAQTKISILPVTPPPPPPPPPKDQPKEPPKEQPKAAPVEQPKPVDRPPDEQLKMEGAAGNGPSPFGAGSVSKDYVGQPTGGGGGRMQYGLYSASLQRFLQNALGKNAALRSRDYRITLNIWLSRDGSLQNYEIAGSSGDVDIDEALKSALAKISSVHEAPPESMPQPVRIRISNRGIS